MIRILLVLFSLLGFVSCGKGLQVSKLSSLDPTEQNCKIASKQLSLPAEKLSRDEFYMMADDKDASKNILSSELNGDLLFDKETEFAITVNTFCMYTRLEDQSYKNYPLTKALQLKFKKAGYSEEDTYLLKWDKAVEMSVLEKLAENDQCVVSVARNLTLTTQSEPNDPRYGEQTHLAAINFGVNYDGFFNEPNTITNDTIIAVIDNGVDINHPDLQGHLWINMAEKNGTANFDDDGNGFKDDIYGYDFATNVADPNHKYTGSSLGYSHGSHVSGLSAAVANNSTGVSGVMGKHAKIMALNVFGNSQGAATTNIDNAIRYAADMGAKIINMSLGGPGATSSTQRAIQYAVSKGAFVVVAAGNDSMVLTSSNLVTPASYGLGIDGMITVGATDSNPASVGNLCSFSNKSPSYVEIGAPGCDTTKSGVLSLLRNSGYGLMQGTSMASPVAAGVAAVIYSYVRDRYKKTLTPAELELLMKSGSKNFAQLSSYITGGKNTDLSTLKEKIIADLGPGDNGGGGDGGGPNCP